MKSIIAALLGVVGGGSLVIYLIEERNRRRRLSLTPSAANGEAGPESGVGVPLPGSAIYLDWNATSRIYPEVAHEIMPYIFEKFGNPGSLHVYGIKCKQAVAKARWRVASMLQCSPEEVYFTSCGSEADNWAIKGAIETGRTRLADSSKKPHVITSAIEHPAVLITLENLVKANKIELTVLSVSKEGIIDPTTVGEAIRPEQTVLVTIMHSNNEVGSIQSIAEIAGICRAYGKIIFHTDAAQSVGKVPVVASELGADLITIVGHKFGATKGIGALHIRKGVTIGSLIEGGGQEGGLRSGTENVALIVGMGKAAEIAAHSLNAVKQHMETCTAALRLGLVREIGKGYLQFNGPSDPSLRLPNTTSVSFKGMRGFCIVEQLVNKVAISSGAACHAEHVTVSYVLEAMGVDREWGEGTIRISCGRHTTLEEVDEAVKYIAAAVKKLRLILGFINKVKGVTNSVLGRGHNGSKQTMNATDLVKQ